MVLWIRIQSQVLRYCKHKFWQINMNQHLYYYKIFEFFFKLSVGVNFNNKR
jgi:hypothetical protein